MKKAQVGYLFSPLSGGHHRHYCEIYTQIFLSLFEKVILYSPPENLPYKISPRLTVKALPTNPLITWLSRGMTYAGSLVFWAYLYKGPRQASKNEPGPLLVLFGDVLRSAWVGKKAACFLFPQVTWVLVMNLYSNRGLEAKHWDWLRSDRVKKIGILDERNQSHLSPEIQSKLFWLPEVTG